MSVSLLDNFSYNGKKPNFSRDLMPSIEVMKNYSENYLPPVFTTLCEEDGKRYRYNVSNSEDPVLGKWRLDEGGSSDLTDYYKKTETNELLDTKVDKEEGKGLSEENFTTVYKIKIGDSVLTTTAQNISDAINEIKEAIDDTTLADKVEELEDHIDLLDNVDKTVEGSIRYLDAQIYNDSKDYTDEQIAKVNKKKAIPCDERPIYTQGATIEEDTITYILDGVSHTIPADEIWFYFMEESDLNADGMIGANEVGLVQIIWISRTPFEIMSFGLDMTEYVNKNLDVVSTYTGEESDTSKVPNLASMKALETKVMTEVDKKIDKDDIEDSLTSTSTDKVLSANQGKVIKDELDNKLSIEQGSGNANKRVVTDSSGNIILADEEEISSEEVSYENTEHTDCDNVKLALDKIFKKIYYIAPKIESFTMTPSTDTYEVGETVTSLSFAWTYDKDVSSQSLTDVTLTDETDRSGSWTGSLSTNKTFTLTCSDGENSASATKTISFKNKIYWGGAELFEDFASSFILGLSNNKFATSYKGTYSMTVANSQFGFICCPQSWNMPNIAKIGGFGTDLVNVGNFSFTNSSGASVSYKIVRTSISGLGKIDIVFD